MLNIKDLYKVFSEADKIDEYQKILELIDNSFAKREKIELLDKENKELKEKLRFSNKVTIKKGAYWVNEDGPFCTRCFDKNKELIRIHPTFPGSDLSFCPECKNTFNTTGKTENSLGVYIPNFD